MGLECVTGFDRCSRSGERGKSKLSLRYPHQAPYRSRFMIILCMSSITGPLLWGTVSKLEAV
jgi:hypothetical protein